MGFLDLITWPATPAYPPLSDAEMFESWVVFGGDSTLYEYTSAYLACMEGAPHD